MVTPLALTGIEYALDNPARSSMALTFIVIMAPFFMLAMHAMALLLPPLYVLLRRIGIPRWVTVMSTLPVGGAFGMALLNMLFASALHPQCTYMGTFL